MPLSSFRATLKEWPNACASCGTPANVTREIPEKCREMFDSVQAVVISGGFGMEVLTWLSYANVMPTCLLSVESLGPQGPGLNHLHGGEWPLAPGVSRVVASRLAKASRAVRNQRGIGCVAVQ